MQLQHGGVFQKIDMSHFHFHDVQARTTFQIGYHFFSFFGKNQIQFIVQHQLGGYMLDKAILFAKPDSQNENQIGQQQFHIRNGDSQRINHRQRDDDKKISHFAHRHGFRPITDDTENSKEPQSETHFQFDASQQEYQEENTDTDQKESKIIISSATLFIILKMDNKPRNQQVDAKMKEQSQSACIFQNIFYYIFKQIKFNCSNIQNVPASSNKTSSKSSNIQNVPTVPSRKCRKDQFRSKSKHKI